MAVSDLQVFRSRCRILFERMFSCTVEDTASDGFDLIVHANESELMVRCIFSYGEICKQTVDTIHSYITDESCNYIIITNGSFSEDVDVRDYPDMRLIGGTECVSLFMRYDVPVIPMDCVPPEKRMFDQNVHDNRNSSGDRRLMCILAVIFSMITPGGGFIFLFYLDRKWKYALWGNLLCWPSFVYMFNIIPVSDSSQISLVVCSIQVISILSTYYYIDPVTRKDLGRLVDYMTKTYVVIALFIAVYSGIISLP